MIPWHFRPAAAPLIIVLVGAACGGTGGSGSSSGTGDPPMSGSTIDVQAMDAIGDSISKGLNADVASSAAR